MTREQLILVAQGRSYIANGTGKAVRIANRLSLQDWASAMAAVLEEPVSPSTVCRYELHQRRGGPRHAAAYAAVVKRPPSGDAVVTLHALHPASEAALPSWDAVWDVEQLAAYARVTTQTIYAAVARGDWDFARLPTGRAIRFSGPALAARFMVPGYQKG